MKTDFSEFEQTTQKKQKFGRSLSLIAYDLLLFVCVILLVYFGYRLMNYQELPFVSHLWMHAVILGACIFAARFLFGVYKQILRYGGSSV